MNEKLNWYGHHLNDQDRSAIEHEAWKAEYAGAAMGRILATFSSDVDQALRGSVIDYAATLAPKMAIDTLWGTARGVGARHRGEVKWANEKIMALQWANQNSLPNIYISAENRHQLQNTGIDAKSAFNSHVVSVEPMNEGKGMSETFIIRFENGKRAIFKPLWGENSYNKPNAHLNRIGFSREAQAFLFYQRYFKTDGIHLPLTVEAAVHFNGRHFGVGSLQEFAEGYDTLAKKYTPWGYQYDWQNLGPIWAKQREDGRWDGLAPWVQTFDYIIGNVDRFPHDKAPTGNPNNILVKENGYGGLEVGLIDNAKGRGYPLSLDYIPPAQAIPLGLRDWIKSFNDEKIDQIRRDFAYQLPRDAVEDMVQRIRNVQNHIRYFGF